MARKRARDDDDTEEDVEIESASSSFRQGSGHKRNRVVMARQRGGSTVSDDDDDDDDDGESDRDFERLLHGEEDHSTQDFSREREAEDGEVDQHDELRATQFVHKQMRNTRENVESEYGVIEEVRCRNFMCHENLRIRLGPLINFIIGHNGSGKSAVLTALTMCLGGKATATNRGASLKSLIKEGQESATLAVKIKNQGDGAYKPDLFGQSITVERHFSRSGASGFKIKNQVDKVVTTKKSDLDDMLDYFAFQLDNPINVLTQDMARQFLSNSTPADKYRFFIKGTQLETLDADYRVLEENLDSIEAKTRGRQEDILVLKQKAEEAEQKKKRLDQSQAIRDKMSETRWMHAWAQVEEQEGILAARERDLKLAKDRVDELLNEAEDKGGAYEGHNQAFEAADRGLNDAKEQLEPLQEGYNSAKEVFDKNTKELMEHKAQERSIKGDLNSARQRKTKLEQEVEAEQARLDAAEGPEHGERFRKLEELKRKAEHVKEREREHRATLPPLEQTKIDARKAEAEAKPAVQEQATAYEKAQGLVSRLSNTQGDQYAAYKGGMALLVRAINNETRWRQKPVGPAGLHVRLLKPEWASIIEKTFGGVLDSFFVTCIEDQRLLNQIMHRQREFPKSSVYIGNAEPLDTTGKEPDEGVDTMLRVLSIDNDLVRNQLIINQSIDQSVLISDRQRAEHYMNGGQRPRNVRVAIAHTSARGGGVRFELTRSGASKASPIQPWTGAFRIQTDRAEQLRRAKENEQEAKRELETRRARIGELKREAEKSNQATIRWQRRLKEIEVEYQRAEDAVQAMTDEIELIKPQDGKLQELQNQLETAKEEIESIGRTYQDGINAKDSLNEKAKEFKARLDVASAELKTCETRIEQADDKRLRLGRLREEALKAKNKALNHVETQKEEVTKQEEGKARQESTVEEYNREASKICARVTVEPGVNCMILDERLDKFTKEWERAQREAGGTREELTEAWRVAKTDYNNAKSQLQDSMTLMRAIKSTLAERRYRWKMFRKYISSRARIMFGYLLEERSFRGTVNMDHENKKLDIAVEPDVTKRSNAGRQTQTLSGGEKSFSTICLLLAIWEAMGSPIRCLDEFDVFMDSVNRSTSMSMMIQAARRSVGRQFILITPQSMANVQMGPDVSVHRMSDPERGQTTLPF